MLQEHEFVVLRPLSEPSNLKRFKDAWNMLRAHLEVKDDSQPQRDVEESIQEATKLIQERRGGTVKRAVVQFQSGIKINVLAVTFGDDRAAFPIENIRDITTAHQRMPTSYDFLKACEWFFPAGVPNHAWWEIGKAVKEAPDAEKNIRLDAQLIALYTPSRVAFVIERLCSVSSLAPFRTALVGAARAYFAGISNASTALLAPLVEGAARRLGEQVATELNRRLDPESVLRVKIDAKHIDLRSLIYWFSDVAIRAILLIRPFHEYRWVPGSFFAREFLIVSDYYILIFDLFQRHCADFFYSNTGDYKGLTGLNRHAMVHAMAPSDLESKGNFCRLLSMFEVLYEAAAYGLNGTDFLPIPVPAPPVGYAGDFALHQIVGTHLAEVRARVADNV